MIAKIDKQRAARKLRKNKGLSIGRISERLGVAKSSVSLWVRDICLTKKQKKELDEHELMARRRNFSFYSNKHKVEAEKLRGIYRKNGFKKAKKDNLFKIICALYWGEGAKSDRGAFAISNCDVDMFLLIGKWLLREGYENKIRFDIACPETVENSDLKIKNYWIKNIPFLKRSNVKSVCRYPVKKTNKNINSNKQPNGTGRVYVCSVELQNIVLGGMDYLKEIGK